MMRRFTRPDGLDQKRPVQRARSGLLCVLLSGVPCAALLAQAPGYSAAAAKPDASVAAPTADDAQRLAEMDRRLNEVTSALDQTQKTLEQSLQEIQRLRKELDSLHAQQAQMQPGSSVPAAAAAAQNAEPVASSSSIHDQDELSALREQQEILQAEVKQLDQTKVETASKYRLRVTGLALFNAFSNSGVVDDAALPTIALPRLPGTSHGSLGATLQQSVLGFEAAGPKIGGARSSASLDLDFFGGISTNSAGYVTTGGVLRMRQTAINLNWDNTLLQVGYTSPLISPLSPTSYATVAEPSLTGSGNLWVWSPQVRVEQRLSLSGQRGVALEGGLISPQSAGYTAVQFDSTVEASRRPGVEGRVSYRSDLSGSKTDRPLVIGIGAYTASQFYKGGTNIHSWAATADWRIPLFTRLDVSGEVYRGRALGGLGGGIYKDVLTGVDINTGLVRTIGVDAAGGWSQLKFHLGSTLEANAIFGIDDVLASNFDNLILSASTNSEMYAARTSSVIGNIVFRPKSYLILSPEYRRLHSWQYTGPGNVANIFTISMGYQF